MKNLASRAGYLVALAVALCGCQSMPPVTAISRPEVKIVDYADAQRRRLVPPKSQFYSRDTVAICVHGFSGRTVTVQIWEQNRGMIKTWSQYIASPTVKTRPTMVDQDIHGTVRVMPGQVTQIENDYVVPWTQPPPGRYEVRVISNEGIVQQGWFSVSN